MRYLIWLLLIPSLVFAEWKQVEPGLELGRFDDIVILRVSTEQFDLKLLSAGDGELKTAKQWCNESGAVAAINASMYQRDKRTSISYMKSGSYVNNSYFSKDKTILAFDSKNDSVPKATIIDTTCDDFKEVSKNYDTLIQNIRMISCRGNNVWSQQQRKHTTTSIGIDKKGRILLIYCWYAHTTHDLINKLLALPIDIDRAMYTEGNTVAQMYLRRTGKLHDRGWAIPNVIAVMRKEK